MLKKAPWNYPLAIFCDSIRVRNVGGTGTTYHMVPSSLHEIVPALEEQVLECFAPGKAPDVVNFSDDPAPNPAPNTISVSIRTLSDAFNKFNQCMDNINQNLEQHPHRERRQTTETDVDSDLEIERFNDSIRRRRDEDDLRRRDWSRREREDRHRSPDDPQPEEGFASLAQQRDFTAVYGEPNEPIQACLARMYQQYGQTGETRPDCYRRLIRLGLEPETPESGSGTSANTSSSTPTSASTSITSTASTILPGSTSSTAETPATVTATTAANTNTVAASVQPVVRIPPFSSSTEPPPPLAITQTSPATNDRPIPSVNQASGSGATQQSIPGGSRSTPTVRRPPFVGAEPFTTMHSAFQTASATAVRNPEDELTTESGTSSLESRPSSSASALLQSEQDNIEVQVHDDNDVPHMLNVPPHLYVEGLRGLLEDLDEFPSTLVARNEREQLLIMSRHLQVSIISWSIDYQHITLNLDACGTLQAATKYHYHNQDHHKTPVQI